MHLKEKKGYTLVEVMMALAITLTLFGSMVMTFLAVKSINTMARHKIQAVQLVRGQIENLKAGAFANIANATTVASYDAGPDGTFGNADDMQGTLTTTVQDFLDFDGDGNMAEALINVDSTGGNDAVAVPLRVSFAWNEYVIGSTRAMTVSADTVIAQ
jgi:prepilin-type N-terminal cleavage/methylation domain-containing protein